MNISFGDWMDSKLSVGKVIAYRQVDEKPLP